MPLVSQTMLAEMCGCWLTSRSSSKHTTVVRHLRTIQLQKKSAGPRLIAFLGLCVLLEFFRSSATFVMGRVHQQSSNHRVYRKQFVKTFHRASGDAELEAAELQRQADELRQQAEAEQELLQAQQRLRAEKEKLGPKADLAESLAAVEKKLETASAKLRKAAAFKLPESEGLKIEVEKLEQQAAELRDQLAPKEEATPAPAVPEPASQSRAPGVPLWVHKDGKPVVEWNDKDWEDVARTASEMSLERRFDLAQIVGRDGRRRLSEIERRLEEERRQEEIRLEEKRGEEEKKKEAIRLEEVRASTKKLASKLTFEKLKDMSNEDRIQLAQEAGPAFVISLLMVAVVYYSLNLPVLAYAYHEATGSWPNITDFGALDTVTAAGAVAGVISVATLLKPVRWLVALLITPWTAENILPLFPWLVQQKE